MFSEALQATVIKSKATVFDLYIAETANNPPNLNTFGFSIPKAVCLLNYIPPPPVLK